MTFWPPVLIPTSYRSQRAFCYRCWGETVLPNSLFKKLSAQPLGTLWSRFVFLSHLKSQVPAFLPQYQWISSLIWASEQENFTVETQFQTTQTAEELESAFAPGSEFGFDATLEIVRPDSGTTTSDSDPDSDSSEPETWRCQRMYVLRFTVLVSGITKTASAMHFLFF